MRASFGLVHQRRQYFRGRLAIVEGGNERLHDRNRPVEGPRIDNVLHARAKATGSTYEQVREKLVGNMSLRRMIQPQDIANMILFLCSESGRNVTGQNLRVCGNTESLR